MDSGLLTRLSAGKFQEGSAHERLATFILDAAVDVAGMNVRELASAANVSASTVERLCRRVGCTGYRDFQQSLAYSLALRQASESLADPTVEPDDTTAQTIEKVTRRNIGALEVGERLLKPSVIDSCVELLCRARTVNLFGLGASFLVAKDLQSKLMRVAKPTNLDADWNVQLLYARNMTPDDLAIAVSYTGLTREVAECLRVAHVQGAKVISITGGSKRTRVAARSDYILPVGNTEAYLRSGAMTSRLAQLNVVDVLFSAYLASDPDGFADIYLHNYIGKDE